MENIMNLLVDLLNGIALWTVDIMIFSLSDVWLGVYVPVCLSMAGVSAGVAHTGLCISSEFDLLLF